MITSYQFYLGLAGIIAGAALLITIAGGIVLWNLRELANIHVRQKISNENSHAGDMARVEASRDAQMARLREESACRCPRCGNHMEIVRKDSGDGKAANPLKVAR